MGADGGNEVKLRQFEALSQKDREVPLLDLKSLLKVRRHRRLRSEVQKVNFSPVLRLVIRPRCLILVPRAQRDL